MCVIDSLTALDHLQMYRGHWCRVFFHHLVLQADMPAVHTPMSRSESCNNKKSAVWQRCQQKHVLCSMANDYATESVNRQIHKVRKRTCPRLVR